MQPTGLIPRSRLKWIPPHRRFAHEVAYFLHDEMARMLVEVEGNKGHFVSVTFPNKAKAKKFEELSAKHDPLDVLLKLGYPAKARRFVCNQITMAMVSDCLHHIYEALSCMERRKFIVSMNLLRKPLKDNLVYLSWMLADERDFYTQFMSGNPDLLTANRVGNRRKELIEKAIGNTDVADIIDADRILEILFDAKSQIGFEMPFQHAVHLITVQRPELKTSPQNFNFIFKKNSDDDIYEIVYTWLPYVLLFLSHVVLNLYRRVTSLNKGGVRAFIVRSKAAYLLTLNGLDSWVGKTLGEVFSGNCDDCNTPLKITKYNAALLVVRDMYRCPGCKRLTHIPLSWMI